MIHNYMNPCTRLTPNLKSQQRKQQVKSVAIPRNQACVYITKMACDMQTKLASLDPKTCCLMVDGADAFLDYLSRQRRRSNLSYKSRSKSGL